MTRSAEQLRQDIEKTRSDLSSDVAALTSKVSPQRIVGERVDRVRGAWRNVKEKVMGTASEMGHAGKSMASSAAHQIGTTASEMGHAGKSMASSAAHQVGAATSTIGDMAKPARWQMPREQVQGSPLAAGLIAFGMGVLVSSIFPPSQREQRMANRVLDEAYERVGGIRQQTMDAAQHVREDVKASVRRAAMESAKSAGHAATEVVREGRSAAHDARAQVQEDREAGRY